MKQLSSNNSTKNIPKLRFPEFEREWEEFRIKNILKIFHGKDYKEFKKGEYPVLGTGGIITYIDSYLCNWECCLIGRKGTISKPQYMDKPFWSVDTLFYSKPKKNQNAKLQYYLFQKINWLKYNEASGVPSLSAKTIEGIKVKIPKVKEQQKIASFLTLIDKKIEKQQELIEKLKLYKRGVTQKIFSQELRFKDDDGGEFSEWEEKKLGDVLIANKKNLFLLLIYTKK